VFNYVKEEQDVNSQSLFLVNTFSGGVNYAQKINLKKTHDFSEGELKGSALDVQADLVRSSDSAGETSSPLDVGISPTKFNDTGALISKLEYFNWLLKCRKLVGERLDQDTDIKVYYYGIGGGRPGPQSGVEDIDLISPLLATNYLHLIGLDASRYSGPTKGVIEKELSFIQGLENIKEKEEQGVVTINDAGIDTETGRGVVVVKFPYLGKDREVKIFYGKNALYEYPDELKDGYDVLYQRGLASAFRKMDSQFKKTLLGLLKPKGLVILETVFSRFQELADNINLISDGYIKPVPENDFPGDGVRAFKVFSKDGPEIKLDPAAVKEQEALRSSLPAATLPAHGGPLGLDILGTSMGLLSFYLEDKMEKGPTTQGEREVIAQVERVLKKYSDLYSEYQGHLEKFLVIEKASWDDLSAFQAALTAQKTQYSAWLNKLLLEGTGLPYFIKAIEPAKALFVHDEGALAAIKHTQDMMIRFQKFYIPFFQMYLNEDADSRQAWPEIDVSTLISEFLGVRTKGPAHLTDFILQTKMDFLLEGKGLKAPVLDFKPDSGYKVKADPLLLMFIVERMEENARGLFYSLIYKGYMDEAAEKWRIGPPLTKEDLHTTYKIEDAFNEQGKPVVRLTISNPGIMPEDLRVIDEKVGIPVFALWKKVRKSNTSGGTSLPAIWRVVVDLLGGKLSYNNVPSNGVPDR
jgi:hypothetical protein